jgi:hypothetical protein
VPLDDHDVICTRGCAVDCGGDAAAEKRGSTPRRLHHPDMLVMSQEAEMITELEYGAPLATFRFWQKVDTSVPPVVALLAGDHFAGFRRVILSRAEGSIALVELELWSVEAIEAFLPQYTAALEYAYVADGFNPYLLAVDSPDPAILAQIEAYLAAYGVSVAKLCDRLGWN